MRHQANAALRNGTSTGCAIAQPMAYDATVAAGTRSMGLGAIDNGQSESAMAETWDAGCHR